MTDKNMPKSRRFSLSNLKTKSKVISVALLPLLLIVGVGLMTTMNLQRMEDSSHWVEHSERVLIDSTSITASAVEMETGLRGYLLAGQEDFLDPYYVGEAQAYQALSDLRETVRDNPGNVARLDEAEQALRGWQADVAECAISLRHQVGDAMAINDMVRRNHQGRGEVFL